jgi:hypothetical protein
MITHHIFHIKTLCPLWYLSHSFYRCYSSHRLSIPPLLISWNKQCFRKCIISNTYSYSEKKRFTKYLQKKIIEKSLKRIINDLFSGIKNKTNEENILVKIIQVENFYIECNYQGYRQTIVHSSTSKNISLCKAPHKL